jgi:hypothetical protein
LTASLQGRGRFSFTPALPQTVLDVHDEFLLGTLTFTNGIWFGLGPVNRFHIELTTVSTDPAFNNKTLSDDLVMDIMVNNAPGNTPGDNADCFYFSQFSAIGSPCAYETGLPGLPNSVSVRLLGRVGSLIPTRFTDVTGGFLLDAPTTAAPEPLSLILVGTGLAVGLRRRRRTR